MNDLDSRGLALTDCYGQRFMRPGVYPYDVRSVGFAGLGSAYPFAVEVRDEPSGKMVQHDVVVRAEGQRFSVEPAKVTIGVGDLVLWHSPERGRPFVIDGEAVFFGSDSLRNECGYSHAFGLPGDYEWVDANGSGLRGVVRVNDPRIACDDDRRQWFARLRNAALVMIRGTHAEPAEVAIETGQRVYFAVVASSGVTVTDVRLLACAAPASPQASSV